MNDKNTAGQLRDHLFKQMERLNDPNADLNKELNRATALAKVGTVIVNSAKQELDMMRLAHSMKPKQPAAKQIEMKPVKSKGKKIANG
jgi:hypothetical protein